VSGGRLARTTGEHAASGAGDDYTREANELPPTEQESTRRTALGSIHCQLDALGHEFLAER
jgi:hypothetical protein